MLWSVKLTPNSMIRLAQMRETVADFYASRYARCLAALERWRPALQLDAGLARHLPALVAAIRERALLQYATPFSSVDLAAMAAAFNTSIGRVACLLRPQCPDATVTSPRVLLTPGLHLLHALFGTQVAQP